MQQTQVQGQIKIEQILAGGKPAVKVSFPKGIRYYQFPSNKPGLAVGQFSDKIIPKPLNEQPNTDESSYQDYLAWMERFHQVYEAS